MKNGKQHIVWAPQEGPQHALIDCPLPEVFFGGARGGGKTDGVLGKWAIKEARYGPAFNAMMFRRTTVSAEDAVDRSKEIYAPLGGKLNESKLVWRMPNGGRVGFGYLDSVKDAEAWQGRNLTDAWIEEAGQFENSTPIDRLQGVLRSAKGVPTQLVITANPGGRGQHWISKRYQLIPFPKTSFIINRRLPNGNIYPVAVIPSRITDNRILIDSDPGYIDRLYQVGSAKLVDAWLEGNWAAVEGAFFDEWDDKKHVLDSDEFPDWWTKFRSGDWGSAKPFSFGWWTVASDEWQHKSGAIIPRGALIRYKEWYGVQRDEVTGETKPNTGLKMSAEEVARGILEMDGAKFDNTGKMIKKPTTKINTGALDPAAFAVVSGPSIGETMSTVGVHMTAADNRRVGGKGALGGWDQMRGRLKGLPDGRPMLYCFNTCANSIRTIPVLQHDEKRPEDLDTESEDHAADDWRYGCMSRPWTSEEPIEGPNADKWDKAFEKAEHAEGTWRT